MKFNGSLKGSRKQTMIINLPECLKHVKRILIRLL